MLGTGKDARKETGVAVKKKKKTVKERVEATELETRPSNPPMSVGVVLTVLLVPLRVTAQLSTAKQTELKTSIACTMARLPEREKSRPSDEERRFRRTQRRH